MWSVELNGHTVTERPTLEALQSYLLDHYEEMPRFDRLAREVNGQEFVMDMMQLREFNNIMQEFSHQSWLAAGAPKRRA